MEFHKINSENLKQTDEYSLDLLNGPPFMKISYHHAKYQNQRQ